jgi:hypothetical protein
MVHITAESQGAAATAPDNQVNVVTRVRTDGIALSITNGGATPVDVLWQKSVLVDTEEQASSVVHGEGRAMAVTVRLSDGEDISRIPPGATLEDVIVPASRVVFDPYYGWVVEPLLKVECGPIRCTGYEELVGKSVRLILTMRVDGNERVMDRTYRITATDKSMRGSRGEDQTVQ